MMRKITAIFLVLIAVLIIVFVINPQGYFDDIDQVFAQSSPTIAGEFAGNVAEDETEEVTEEATTAPMPTSTATATMIAPATFEAEVAQEDATPTREVATWTATAGPVITNTPMPTRTIEPTVGFGGSQATVRPTVGFGEVQPTVRPTVGFGG